MVAHPASEVFRAWYEAIVQFSRQKENQSRGASNACTNASAKGSPRHNLATSACVGAIRGSDTRVSHYKRGSLASRALDSENHGRAGRPENGLAV